MFKKLWPVLVNPVIARISPNRIVYTASASYGFLDYRLTRAGWLSSLTVRIAYSFAHNLNNTNIQLNTLGYRRAPTLTLVSANSHDHARSR